MGARKGAKNASPRACTIFNDSLLRCLVYWYVPAFTLPPCIIPSPCTRGCSRVRGSVWIIRLRPIIDAQDALRSAPDPRRPHCRQRPQMLQERCRIRIRHNSGMPLRHHPVIPMPCYQGSYRLWTTKALRHRLRKLCRIPVHRMHDRFLQHRLPWRNPFPCCCCSYTCSSCCDSTDRPSGQFSHRLLRGMGGRLEGQNRLHVSLVV